MQRRGQVLRAQGRLPWPRSQNLLLQLVSALESAHALGIIHRDIKPSNCFLVDVPGQPGRDYLKVLDFGIAKLAPGLGEETQGLTATDEVFGTVAYMSPEMANGITNDSRSDIYAVGVMMYQMLTGVLPFTEGNAFQILAQHVSVAPPRPRGIEASIPEGVERVILRALAKDPADRFQTMTDLANALREGDVADGGVVTGEPRTMRMVGPGDTPTPSTDPTLLLGHSAPLGTVRSTDPSLSRGPDGDTPVSVPIGPTEMLGQPSSQPMSLLGPPAAPVPAEPTTPRGFGRAVLLLVVLLGLGIAVGLGVVLGSSLGSDGEATPAVAKGEAPEATEEAVTAAKAPAKAPPTEVEAPVEVVEPSPTPPEADSGGAAVGEQAVELEPEPAALPEPEPEPKKRRKSTTNKPTATKPKVLTDAEVVAALKRKIISVCKVDGATTVKLEGAIATTGRVASPMARPSSGVGACARDEVKKATFQPGARMRPMPRFEVSL